ncbi:phosphatidylserine decarboxylase [Clostridiaceae bacterium 35-E11]
MMDIYYIDRKTGEKKKEVVAGERFLKWIYDTKQGNTLLELLVKKKVFSFLYGKLQDMSWSKRKIKKFVENLSIDMTEADRENIYDYENFNDFFARKLKETARPISKDCEQLISPADGRVLAYENIDMNRMVQIKGNFYKLEELFQDNELARNYEEGTCIIVRLCPADYHRFHFPDSGVPGTSKQIKGQYYSVNPMALGKLTDIYCRNKREITFFRSDHFGEIVFVEVGATCVGSIIQTYIPDKHVKKGGEKGYFKFGGSTVILFLKKNKVKIDEDIVYNTQKGIETKANMGETLGKRIVNQ